MNQAQPPHLECDIVMKGGITSGVVYPLAVVELSKTYRFVNIGGTSAGAIAAAATAAAELGRNPSRPNQGFRLLEALPKWLQENAKGTTGSRLMALFQAQPRTRKLFQIMQAAIKPGNKPSNTSLAAARAYGRNALIGALPGLIALWLMRPSNALEMILSGLIGVLVLGIGVLAAVAFGLYQSVSQLPQNGFGLCSGYRPVLDEETADPPLTEWLHQYLNSLAGRPADGPPLTFADLRSANINLMMMTTDLTHGLPQRLPFDTGMFFYDPEEFRKLFPPQVNDYLKSFNATLEAKGKKAQTFPNGKPLKRIPEGDDLPVVVAVRMSLSFPVLLSAIPLYSFHKGQNDSEAIPKRCWFSDGGITSNFPVHFFDSPLPTRPTFAINLIPLQDGEYADTDESRNVWMPNNNQGGIRPKRSDLDQPQSGLGALLSFFAAIFSTAQNWVDNSQLLMPGYRDRIAHVKLQPSEGSLNLNMDKKTLDRLTERGKAAGSKLVRRFTGKDLDAQGKPNPLDWRNHRWVRYRATMAALETYLSQLHENYSKPPTPGEPSYTDLIARDSSDLPSSYRLNKVPDKKKDEPRFAAETTKELMELIEHWLQRQQVYNARFAGSGAPRPRAVLRAQPGGTTPPKPGQADTGTSEDEDLS